MSKVWNIPNILTMSRIVLSPIFFILFLNDERMLGLLIFIIVAVTDVVDGWIARSSKQVTRFGATWDPMADKLMVALAIISIIIMSDFPLWGLLILVRDVISLAGSVLIFKKERTHWKPNIFGKLTTFLQVITISVYMLNGRLLLFGIGHKIIILYVTILFSMMTAVSYASRGIKVVLKK